MSLNAAHSGFRPRWLAIVAAAVAGASTLGLAGPAQAGAPTRIHAEYWSVDCAYALTGGSTLFMFGSGTTDGAEGGIGGFVENADGELIAEAFTPDFTFGDTFATRLDFGGNEFVLDTALTFGVPETTVLNERSGNSWTKGTTTETHVDVSPTRASYGGETIDLAGGGCSGAVTAFDVRTTNPAATVYRDHDFDSDICSVDGLPDGEVRVTGVLPDAYVEVVLDHGDAGAEKAQGELRLRGGAGTLDAEVVDLFTGEVTTTATIAVDLERAGRTQRFTETFGGITERRSVTPYREEIAVSFADGRQGTATCLGIESTTQVTISPHAEL